MSQKKAKERRREEERIVTPERVRQAAGVARTTSRMLDAIRTQQAGFLKAFMEQTGLRPDEAKMIYGHKTVDGRSQFSIYFVRREEHEELLELREFFRAVAKEGTPRGMLRELLEKYPHLALDKP